MDWGEGDQWTATLEVPHGAEFKLVVCNSRGVVEWETGSNRVLNSNGPEVVMEWGNTALMAAPAQVREGEEGGYMRRGDGKADERTEKGKEMSECQVAYLWRSTMVQEAR